MCKTVINKKLKLETENVIKCADVITKVKAFTGIGWVCGTGSKEIITGAANQIPDDIGWIISAEFANDNESLHVTRIGAEWQLTTITKNDEYGDSKLETVSYLARGEKLKLKYEVEWRPENINGITELHPVAYRFAGFEGGLK